jgi:hypothetical protein
MHQVMIFTAALVQLYRVELAVIKAFNFRWAVFNRPVDWRLWLYIYNYIYIIIYIHIYYIYIYGVILSNINGIIKIHELGNLIGLASAQMSVVSVSEIFWGPGLHVILPELFDRTVAASHVLVAGAAWA